MKLYLILGAIFIGIAAALGFSVGLIVLDATILEVILNICITFFTLFAIDAIIALLVRAFPKKWVNPFNKIYKVHNWEKKLYLKLGVRKWKDIIPESGKALVGFDKRSVKEMNDNTYLTKFMEESVIAELMHFFSFIASALLILVPLKLGVTVRLPIIICNMIYQMLPVIVQRYNRPKLMLAYERNLRIQQRENNKKDN